ncbi:DNA polymerase-3 subunit gamma/tau [Litorivivens lipolytica]|uniref:DNA polymerase III subunit gamma/tau n=1 Tax=Litorivivens lipolytica TaxID=1524264 RepID=A0A7W4Z632_9GAMM|nr:DNA polymerase III subunit gamma/tau [Litorivivens lipolytica]MBB3046516.1 DNA polymerase-3 subunit gamma/tau [Litorivivens lipolytica]
MSYQVLARKWRPKSFRELAGQAHVLKALVNALDHDRLHHAYLFTGTRGVGKTTIARILAKCLNCETGVSSEPCGTCDACVSIGEGRFVDLIEVDAASKTKVDDTRELLENVQYTPTRGRYKVYLIDEVHMLSTHSFNALLKTLEEPPPHVKFLLATTDPQKIPATILSRCLQFSLKNMTPEKIVEHLTHILGQEMIGFDEAALWQLARSAQGSMRDALSLTDQAIAFGGGKLNAADVESMLGTIDHTAVADLARCLAEGNAPELLDVIARQSEQGVDFAAVLGELLSLLHRIAIAQAVPDAVDKTLPDSATVIEMAGAIAPEDVQFFYQVGLSGRRDLPLAPDARSGLEMILLRMLAFKPAGVHQLPAAAPGGAGTPAKKPSATQAEAAQAAPVSQQQNKPQPQSVASQPQAAPPEPEQVSEPSGVSPGSEQSVIKPAGVAHSAVVGLSDLTPLLWRERFDDFGLAGLLRSICSHCVLDSVQGSKLMFSIAQSNAHLLNDTHIERFEKALQAYFEHDLSLTVNQVEEVEQETPAEYQLRREQENLDQLKMLIREDPHVLRLMQEFQATVDENSIRPASDK